MKKIKSTLILLLISSVIFGQNELSIEVKEASYKIKDSKITFSFSIKNNTDSILYIISPKKYFFNKHLDQRNQASSNGLDIPAYDIDIRSNKKCKLDTDGYYEQIMGDTNPMSLISHIVEIKANESKTFDDIEINRFDGSFCSKREYKINITYKPNISFDTELINSLKKSYDLILKETKDLNGLLYYNLSDYRSIEKDNFKKLGELLTKIPNIQSINNKVFKSNTIIATEKN